MNEHVFQCRSENTDPNQFVVTLEKLSHYVMKKITSASDLDSIFSNFTTPIVTKPTKPTETDEVVDVAKFSKGVNEYVKRRNLFRDNTKRLYSVIWGQSIKPVRELVRLKNFKEFDDEKTLLLS